LLFNDTFVIATPERSECVSTLKNKKKQHEQKYPKRLGGANAELFIGFQNKSNA